MADSAEATPNNTQPVSTTEPVSWTGLPRHIITYVLIVVIGTTVIHTAFVNSTLQFVNQVGLPPSLSELVGGALANAQQAERQSGLVGLIVSNIAVVIAGVVAMLALAIITHLIITFILRGKGTVPDQTAALLQVYNRWLPIEYVLLVIAAVFAWGAIPESLCLFAPGLFLALYVGARIPAKIAGVYGVSARRGCMAYVGAIIVFSVISGGLFAVLLYWLIFALDYRF